MKIIALRGGDSCGKTTTLNIVYDKVIAGGGVSTSRKQEGADPNDFSDIVLYKGLKVAFFTMGDYSVYIINAINNYNAIGADVLILASNIKFVKPIRLIVTFTHNIVIKTIASPSNTANDLVANTADANTIFGLI